MIERLHRWSRPPELGNIELNRQANLLYFVLVILLPCTLGFVIVLALLAPENTVARTVSVAAFFIELSTLFLLRRGMLRPAGIAMLLALWASMLTSMYLGDGVRSVSVLGQVLIILMAGLLVYAPFAIGLTFATILANYALMIVQNSGLSQPQFVLDLPAYWAVQSLFFLVAVGLSQVYVYSLRRAFNDAQHKEDSLVGRVTELRQAQAQLEMNEQNLRRREAILETVSVAAERLFRGRSFADSVNLVVRDLGAATGVDRVRIFENAQDSAGELMTHEVYAWAAAHLPEMMHLGRFKSLHFREAGMLRWAEVLSRNLAIKSEVQHLPDAERRRLQAQGIKSILVMPIFVGDEWWGFISFDEIKWERSWSPAEEDALRGAAGILGGAIQRQRVERALNRSEQQYLAILQDQTDMICRYTPQGRINFANEAYEQFFGVGRVVGRLIWEQLGDEQEVQELQAKIASITPSRSSAVSRNRNRRADGVERWVEWTDRGIFDENGVLVEVQAVGRDVDNEVHLRQQLERSLHETATQAMTDPLTGLLNRRAITLRAEMEWDRAQREQRPLSVVLMDVDRLKQINDGFGHLAGDAALKTLGDLLKTSMRRNDWAGRWGGDEFMLVLPGAQREAAREVAERLRQRIQRTQIDLGDGRETQLQVSMGVASQFTAEQVNGLIVSLDQLFAHADQALYVAKAAGRNRVGLA